MAVAVRIPTVLRVHAGGRSTLDAEPGTVGDVLRQLSDDYPGMAGQLLTQEGELHRFVNVYVNDDDVRYMERLDTKVSDGDVLSILPAVAGGVA